MNSLEPVLINSLEPVAINRPELAVTSGDMSWTL